MTDSSEQPNQAQQAAENEAESAKQTLIAHLIELRTRLVRCVIAMAIVFAGLFGFSNELYLILSEPLRAVLPEGMNLIATGVASPFLVPFKLTFVASIFVTIPIILHQAWSFIAPGMYQHEKKLAIPLLFSSIVLFYCGVAFAYFVVLPLVFGFFTSVAPEGIAVMPDIHNVLNFCLKLFIAFGITFDIPIATFLLIRSGITTVEALSKKRPYIFLGCFVIGMLVTPPDIFSQTILAVPMWLLFEVGLLLGKFSQKGKAQAEQEST